MIVERKDNVGPVFMRAMTYSICKLMRLILTYCGDMGYEMYVRNRIDRIVIRMSGQNVNITRVRPPSCVHSERIYSGTKERTVHGMAMLFMSCRIDFIDDQEARES